jgi:hypothetical protein
VSAGLFYQLKEFYMRWLRMPLVVLSLMTGTGMNARAADPEVWFNPQTPLDYDNMWTPSAPWQHAARKVQVLDIVHWWLDTATDQQILARTDFAKLHHMKLAMSTQAVERFPGNPCGTTEGYSWPGQLTGEVATLHRLGVQLDMITMDEPVWFAHYDTEAGACQLSIPDLAANVASNISGILALYPNVQMYEIETLPGVPNFPDWRNALSEFQTILAQTTGNHMRGIELDMGWSSPAWIPALAEMLQFTHERNLRLGVIEDSFPFITSDAAAVASVVQNFEYMEGTLGIIPDFVEFTTWLPHPRYNMPETSPTAQTWEINRYFRERTLLQAQFVGQGVQGKLTTQRGKPIAGATINGYVPGVDFTQPLATNVVQGVVPSNAVYGLMGIRLNAECGCNGINDVLVGTLQYQETQGGSVSQSYTYPPVPANVNGVIVDGEWVGRTQVTRFITNTTQEFYTNSNWFPVTPGATYSFTIPASTIGGEGWYGNVFLLWGDVNQNGIVRVITVPDAGKRLMSTTTTAADGTFRLSKLPRVGPGSAPVTVEFAGDDTHRSTGWMPLPP